MACSICRRLANSLVLYEKALVSSEVFTGHKDFSLGSSADVDSRSTSGCVSCRSILQSATHSLGDTLTAHFTLKQPRVFILAGRLDGVSSTDFTARLANIYKLSASHYFTTEASTPQERHGRLINPRVDTELVRSWIHRCDTAHKHICRRAYDVYLLPKATLSFIDVLDLCIVTPAVDDAVRYVALSYVWGNLPVLCALKANAADLRLLGAFSDGGQYQLPKTVRDAVRLTAELGVRYLWVDSVCIVQDDVEAHGEQLRAMGAVYANAYLTIVALSGTHADAGICRVGSTSASELASTQQKVISLPLKTLIYAGNGIGPGNDVLNSPGRRWNTRGWTFQERIFSRRLLALDEVAIWSCFGDQWTEDVYSPSEGSDFPILPEHANSKKLGTVTWPSISAYGELAAEYARRDLSWSMDTMNAFTGVMSPMAQWFPGGLLYGIAEFMFDIGMLWNVGSSGVHFRRDPGMASPLINAISGKPPQFPTWSWISWTGELNFDLWSAAEDYRYPRGPLIVSGMAVWEKQLVEGGEWSKIDNTYQVVRNHMAGIDLSNPPDNWIRHFDDRGDAYFQHDRLAHIIPRPRFSYPIPPSVRYRDIDQRPFRPHLRFKGKLAQVCITMSADHRRDIDKRRSSDAAIEVDLTDPEGFWCGRIMLPLEKGDREPQAEEICEVIALSEGALHTKAESAAPVMFDEIRERSELEDAEVYEIINVLWIGRCANGMVFRKALGRIWKPMWEDMISEEVELILT